LRASASARGARPRREQEGEGILGQARVSAVPPAPTKLRRCATSRSTSSP
jgi:hypothetical protein